MKNRRIAIIIILVIAGVLLIVSRFFEKEPGSKETLSLDKYYKLKENEAKLFIDTEEVGEKGIVEEGEGYISLHLAKTIVKRLFYEEENDSMIYTTATEKYVYKLDSKSYIEGEKEKEMDIIPFLYREDEVFVSLSFIQKRREILYKVYENPNRIMLMLDRKECIQTTVKKKTEIRVEPDLKAKIVGELKEDDVLWLQEDEGYEKYDKIVTDDGILGYVLKERLNGKTSVTLGLNHAEAEESYPSLKREKPVVLAWHQVFNETANRQLSSVLNNTREINVISPTWFNIIKEDGELSSLASKQYVKEAHDRGLEVWALVSDFEKKVDFYELFMKEKNRTKLIKNLVYFIDEYDLDGINIDFENIKVEYAEGYVQFLREFSIVMREKQKVFSIDNYVPAPHTDHYDRREQGILADYICVMAYDEHYYGSKEAGSVSSISWVRRGIDMTGEEVDSEKLIIGLPFYTRIWRIKPNGDMETKALSMESGYNRVKKGETKPTWDDSTGQYYAEWKEEKDVLKIWLEDEKSIERKLKEIEKTKVAGLAFWKLGLEKKEVWSKIETWMKE